MYPDEDSNPTVGRLATVETGNIGNTTMNAIEVQATKESIVNQFTMMDEYHTHRFEGEFRLVLMTVGEARPNAVQTLKQNGLINNEVVVYEDAETEDGETIYVGEYQIKGHEKQV